MPRNGSGTYVLPEAPFVPNTPIISASVNSDFSDLAAAMTGSLARDGQGGMTDVLPLANTGFTYQTDPNTGMRRSGADAQAISCGGVDVISASSTGASIAGDLDISGVIKNGGNPIWPVGFVGTWSGLTAPPKWVFARGQNLLRASYPDFWTYVQAEIAAGNTMFNNGNGTTTFGVTDLTGYTLAGRESVATRLTSSFFGGNSTILGAVGGLESHTLTTAQLASHSHANTLNDPGHTHTTSNGTQDTVLGGSGGAATVLRFISSGLNFLNNSTTGMSINNVNAGSGSAHNNVQPTTIVNFIIYAGA